MSHEVPAPINLATIGGTFRLGVADSGNRSSTSWGVVVGRNSRDIYLGPRKALRTVKLSLHQSGVWRFAYTSEAANRLAIQGDRLIHRFSLPKELGPGWRLATVVMIPESSLTARPKRDAGAVQWWPEPAEGFALQFQVWITRDDEADRRGHTIVSAGLAGSCHLNGGGSVFILVDEVNTAAHEAAFRAARAATAARLSPGEDAFSYGLGDDDVPFLVELGKI